jgi:hypothetical protein
MYQNMMILAILYAVLFRKFQHLDMFYLASQPFEIEYTQ